uniref:Transcription factor 19 (SC1), like n=1 Tax=Neogobius melanostomus TaxID=47308 RepID=A0A8C6UHE7_9GOBI
MLSGVQPCFQLLRIGPSVGDSVRDLYTFRPALSQCVFRLGRAPELCDVTLDSASVSRIHAELQAQRETGAPHDEGWRVHVKDRSSHGTWVNEVRLQPGVQWELSDGDTLTFGDQSTPGSGEFYFLFQKVKVRPLDFDAITIPKGGTFSSDFQTRIRTNQDSKTSDNLDLSKLSLNRATVILNSIGSLSKMKGSAWTFKRSQSLEGTGSDHGCPASPPLAPLPSASRSRRKSAHTVLLEDDSSDEPRAVGDDGQRSRSKKRRRLYKSESDSFSSPPLPQSKVHTEVRPVSIKQEVETSYLHRSPQAARGRRRANSSPVFSPLVVGGENYSLASPSVKKSKPITFIAIVVSYFLPVCFCCSKRRGRPRKHPLPPRPSLPSPSSSSSSSTSSASSSSGSSSSSSEDDDDDEEAEEEGQAAGAVEPCAAPRCKLPQQDTVQWIQCDVCDAWYHIDCLHIDRKKLLRDPNADFHCGCR